MTVDVRPARRPDLPTLVQFQLRMAGETENLALDPEVVSRGVAAVFDDPSKGEYLVAERQGEVVACLLTLPEWSDWRAATVLWIHSVYVVEAARGQGVFKAMYARLRARVEASPQLCGLRLYVDKRNVAAAKVYDALGMSAEHYHLYEWLEG